MILVTGGAGYIGSHVARRLKEMQKPCLILDDLSTGFAASIPDDIQFVRGNCGDISLVTHLINSHSITAVMHFAANLVVDESVRNPLKYYANNFVNSLNLLQACRSTGKVRSFIFSSTAAVYGDASTAPIGEDATLLPVSPYGRSKWMTEQLLRDLEAADSRQERGSSMRSVILRYFNVAGANTEGTVGQLNTSATHLVKVAAETALGLRPLLEIFGGDYPTRDGTCVRDFIHVDDLADAHVLALEYLERGGSSDVFNCGYGKGHTVREVVEMMKKVSGVDFPVRVSSRRPGDTMESYADSRKIRSVLGWRPRFDDLETICRTTYAWESRQQGRRP